METKIIHHLDYDCNTLLKEIRFVVNGRLEAIFFKHPNGMKKLFRKPPVCFAYAGIKALTTANADFIKETRRFVPDSNAPLLLKRL